MSPIPQNTVTQEDLNAWSEMVVQLNALKSSEMLLRLKIFKSMFPDPKEGTNTVPLQAGWVLKAGYPIARKPILDLLVARAAELRAVGIVIEDVIRHTPELIVRHYKQLTEDQRHLMDQILEIKPGSPQMEIVLPKRASPE